MAEFWVIRDGERIGPFAEEEILRGYESGALQGSDLLWAEGMADGATVGEAFSQLRKAILTSSQELALADIRPPDRPIGAVEPAPADRADGPLARAVRRRQRRRPLARGALIAVALAGLAAAAYYLFA
jgi:hypothetical protein